MIKRKGGRPRELDYYRKDKVVQVRMNTEEYNELLSLSLESGKSMGEILRRGVHLVNKSWEW